MFQKIKECFKIIPASTYEWMLFSIISYYFSFNAGVLILGKSIYYHVLVSLLALLFLFTLFRLFLRESVPKMDQPICFLLKCLLFWNVTIIIRGILNDMSVIGLIRMLQYPRDVLYYLTPMIAFLFVSKIRLNIIFKWWLIGILISLLLVFYFRDVIMVKSLGALNDFSDESGLSFYNYLAIAGFISASLSGLGFFLICNQWKNGLEKIFVYFSVIAAFIPVLFLGRRGATVSLLLLVSLIYILKLKFKPHLIALLCIAVIILYYALLHYLTDIENALPILFNRLTDDTRTWAVDEFFRDFRGDVGSYLFGRGSKGMYYSVTYGSRGLIESGYLDLILHGGIISLALTVCIYFYAAIMGFFYSRNRLINAMALFLFAQILILYPSTPINLSIGTFGTWFCVACCSNSRLRKSKTFSIYN